MDKEDGDDADPTPTPPKGERWLWLKSQSRDLAAKLDDLSAEFRAIAERLRGGRRHDHDDDNLG